MPILLYKWNTIISTTLCPSNFIPDSIADESVLALIHESEEEMRKVQDHLIEDILDKPKIRDKQQYVQLNQTILIRLLDKLYSYKQYEGLSEKTLQLYNSISQHLENTLNFIEDFFTNYFDRNGKVPSGYLMISIKELCRQLELFQHSLNNNKVIEPTLVNIIVNNFNKFCLKAKISVTYNELVYQKDLMNELLTDETSSSEIYIREVLFYFNFNDDDYVSYLYEKMKALIEFIPTKKEKISALRFEQKNINQLRTKLNCYLSQSMPSLKEQINQWIEEEVKYLEIEQTPEKITNSENEIDGKIHTSLSVAKLALLIKLMVIDKIITNRIVAQV